MIHISDYKKDILKLFTGTSIAQIVPIIAAPLLTRLYVPADFGIYATFFAYSAILSIISTFRFETAIMIAEDENTARNLLHTIFFTSFALSILLQALSFLLAFNFKLTFQIGNWIYFLSLSVFLQAVYQGLYYINLRSKRFKLLAIVRVTFACCTTLLSIGLVFIVDGPTGLILSTMISYTIVCFILYLRSENKFNEFTLNRIWDTFKKYSDFPKFDVPSAFLIQISSRLPVIILANFFPLNIVGYYSLTQRMLDVPLSFVTTAISDTFKQKAAEDFNKNGNCLSVFYETRKLLLYLAVIPFIIIQFFAPQVFGIVFGSEWLEAGTYAQLLAIMFLFRFVISPLTYTFYIRNKLKNNLIGQTGKFLLVLFGMSVGIVLNSIYLALILFAFSNIIILIFYYFYSFKYAKGI